MTKTEGLKETLIYNKFLKIKLMYPLIVMTKSNSFSANFKLVDTVPLYRPIINEMNIDSKLIFGWFNVLLFVLFVETKFPSLLVQRSRRWWYTWTKICFDINFFENYCGTKMIKYYRFHLDDDGSVAAAAAAAAASASWAAWAP